MVIVFGWGRKISKTYLGAFNKTCDKCGIVSTFNIIHQRTWFTLFFIPVIPYETNYFIECNSCKTVFEVGESDVIKLKEYIYEYNERLKQDSNTGEHAGFRTDANGKSGTGNRFTHNHRESGVGTTFAALNAFAFDFPSGWKLREKENPFHLSCVSERDNVITNVWIYNQFDLAEHQTAEDIFTKQIKDIGSKRENFKLVEETRNKNIKGKRIKTAVYSADKERSRFYYTFSLVVLPKYYKFAFVIQTCTPSAYIDYKEILGDIVCSCRPV